MNKECAKSELRIAEYTQNDTLRKRILEKRRDEEFRILGIDPSIVVDSEPQLVRDDNDVLHSVGHFIHIKNKYDYVSPGENEAECDIGALLMYQLDWRDGDATLQADGKPGRLWDFHAMILPYYYRLNGLNVNLPPAITEYGYQVVSRAYLTTPNPHIRIDTLCMTSMPMGGHRSTGGHESLGCDCDAQRYLGQQIVHAAGGMTILSPLEGRGNGLKGHGAQLMRQAMSARYGEPMPDTYRAVEELGFPRDRREEFYPMDTAFVRMFGVPLGNPPKVVLHSNNPEKRKALEREGFLVETMGIFDHTRTGYYTGENFKAKHDLGGHLGFPGDQQETHSLITTNGHSHSILSGNGHIAENMLPQVQPDNPVLTAQYVEEEDFFSV